MPRETLVPLLLLLALPVRLPAQPNPGTAEQPEVIVVTGRLPGPPLWKVSNGDNVLWVFPSFAPIPKRMQWDSTRVERVLAEAGVYLTQPTVGISLSPKSMGLRNLRDSIRREEPRHRGIQAGVRRERRTYAGADEQPPARQGAGLLRARGETRGNRSRRDQAPRE